MSESATTSASATATRGYPTSGRLGDRFGFITEAIPALRLRGARFSSSEIPAPGCRGNRQPGRTPARAPFALQGEVVTGQGIGSKADRARRSTWPLKPACCRRLACNITAHPRPREPACLALRPPMSAIAPLSEATSSRRNLPSQSLDGATPPPSASIFSSASAPSVSSPRPAR